MTLQRSLFRALRLRGQLPASHGALIDTARDQRFEAGEHSSNWTRWKGGDRTLPVDALVTLAFTVDGAAETILRTLAEAFGVEVSFGRDDVRPARDLDEALFEGTELGAQLQRCHRLAMHDGQLDEAERQELLSLTSTLRDHYAGAAERLERDLSETTRPKLRPVS